MLGVGSGLRWWARAMRAAVRTSAPMLMASLPARRPRQVADQIVPFVAVRAREHALLTLGMALQGPQRARRAAG
uniref:hypothetical protein n=1 Tax=Streptomyces sp. NRRL B-24085 TaxID=1709476 RepID=UPI00117F1657